MANTVERSGNISARRGWSVLNRILEPTMRHLYFHEKTLRVTLIRACMAFVILALI